MPKLPKPLLAQMLAYVEHGRPPGVFLTALLTNDHEAAVQHAADDPLVHGSDLKAEILPQVVAVIRSHVPVRAWGDDKRVRAWVGRGGLLGAAQAKSDVR